MASGTEGAPGWRVTSCVAHACVLMMGVAQEVFGLSETPRVAGGRVPVVLELLSPSQQPLQVSRSL